MNDTKNLHKSLFDDIIGQERAKGMLHVELSNYLFMRKISILLLTGPKGQGKTKLARAIAKGLYKFSEDGKELITVKDGNGKGKPVIKPFIEVNASSLTTVAAFINDIIIPFIQDKDVTLFFDEASEIPHKVAMAMLSMLNTEQGDRCTYTHQEYTVEINHKRQSFIFATSELHQIFPPLLDRMEQIDLEEYTPDEMCKIIQKHSEGVKFESDVLNEMATSLRGNARAARKLAANKIVPYLKGRKVFHKKDWATLRKLLGIAPLGLNPTELVILQHLAENNGGMSLTCLAAKTGLSRDAVRLNYETYLQKHGLMRIETSGREITSKGLQLIREIRGVGTTVTEHPKPISCSGIVQNP